MTTMIQPPPVSSTRPMPFSQDKLFPETMRFAPAAREQGESGSEIHPPSSEIGRRIIGDSAALREVLRQTVIVAPMDSTVLIFGMRGSSLLSVSNSQHQLI